jgi:hypothetical protein
VLGTTLFLKKYYILSFLKNVRKGVIRGKVEFAVLSISFELMIMNDNM